MNSFWSLFSRQKLILPCVKTTPGVFCYASIVEYNRFFAIQETIFVIFKFYNHQKIYIKNPEIVHLLFLKTRDFHCALKKKMEKILYSRQISYF